VSSILCWLHGNGWPHCYCCPQLVCFACCVGVLKLLWLHSCAWLVCSCSVDTGWKSTDGFPLWLCDAALCNVVLIGYVVVLMVVGWGVLLRRDVPWDCFWLSWLGSWLLIGLLESLLLLWLGSCSPAGLMLLVVLGAYVLVCVTLVAVFSMLFLLFC